MDEGVQGTVVGNEHRSRDTVPRVLNNTESRKLTSASEPDRQGNHNTPSFSIPRTSLQPRKQLQRIRPQLPHINLTTPLQLPRKIPHAPLGRIREIRPEKHPPPPLPPQKLKQPLQNHRPARKRSVVVEPPRQVQKFIPRKPGTHPGRSERHQPRDAINQTWQSPAAVRQDDLAVRGVFAQSPRRYQVDCRPAGFVRVVESGLREEGGALRRTRGVGRVDEDDCFAGVEGGPDGGESWVP